MILCVFEYCFGFIIMMIFVLKFRVHKFKYHYMRYINWHELNMFK